MDPLLHACIVCASVSCPDVATTAYKPESLDEDMAANMRLFLANDKKGLKLDRDAGTITLSKVTKPSPEESDVCYTLLAFSRGNEDGVGAFSAATGGASRLADQQRDHPPCATDESPCIVTFPRRYSIGSRGTSPKETTSLSSMRYCRTCPKTCRRTSRRRRHPSEYRTSAMTGG